MKAYIKLFCEVIPLIVFFLVNSYEKVIIDPWLIVTAGNYAVTVV